MTDTSSDRDVTDPPTSGISLVLPIGRPSADVLDAVNGYVSVLERAAPRWQVILVAEPGIAGTLAGAANRGGVEVVVAAGGWGSLVRAGLAAATEDVLCYANCALTPPGELGVMLDYALRNPGVVLRANRRTRASGRQRIGSLLFNLECRAALGIQSWDVNGTPKVFRRDRSRLLALTRSDDLIDVEFAAVCEVEGYPVLEIPINTGPAPAARHSTSFVAAARMYVGVLALRRAVRPG